MGVPGFFAWILKNFKKHILTKAIGKVDYLYIDANCLIHPECFKILEALPEETDVEKLENMMFARIINYLNYIEQFVNPAELMYIAVDGSAPLAKIGQQRKRRFRSIDDVHARNIVKRKHGRSINDCWTNTVITPGTDFMERLHNRLLEHYQARKKTQKSKIEYIYSSYHTAGEGEHKILQHMRENRSNLNDGKKIVVYGLDADLIFLTMASNEQNIYLLREQFHLGGVLKKHDDELYDPVSDVAQELMYVSIKETKKAYNQQLLQIISTTQVPSEYLSNKNCLLNDPSVNFTDDLIFICFLLGNDFLPHFPSIYIHNDGMDMIINCYIQCVIETNKLLVQRNEDKSITIDHVFLIILFDMLGRIEYGYFRESFPRHLKSNWSRSCNMHDEYSRDMWALENLRDINVPDVVGLGIGEESEWKFRYYDHYFHTSEHQEDFIKVIAEEYLTGIAWVAKYYFQKCPDWRWQYPFEYAPFISDIAKYLIDTKCDINKIKFVNNEPIPIMSQLLSVLPPQCSDLLPKTYKDLVTNPVSDIIDMFPKKIKLDMLYKFQHWQCTPLIPYLDIDRVLLATGKKKMTTDEKLRSKMLEDLEF